MSFDIFISYKRKSLPTANNLYYRLTTRGYSTFFDLEEMGRDNFNVQLLNYIENAKDVFVILEEGSLDACMGEDWGKDWFCREIAFALAKKKNIIPIRLNGFKMPPENFFPDELKELRLKNSPEFNLSFFEAYLDKLIEKNYLLSEPDIRDKTMSVFKFYSNENCQVFKEGKLVCSLEGMSDKPYYLPVSRKGCYRFKSVNEITKEEWKIEEQIDEDEEKNIEIIWEKKKKLLSKVSKVANKASIRLRIILFSLITMVAVVSAFVFNAINTNSSFIILKEHLRNRKYENIDLKDISHGELFGNYEAVDLGLSVKWAMCNIGADYPYFDGDFFSWGEVITKKDYSWASYKFADGDSITKYCLNEKYGCVDSLIVLNDSDDAAKVIWGNGWRMPTLKETEELKSKCTFQTKRLYGCLGFVVTGPNGNSIFLPMSGDITGFERDGKNIYTIFWTSNLFNNSIDAYEFAMSHLNNYWYSSARNTGHNIRPVHE